MNLNASSVSCAADANPIARALRATGADVDVEATASLRELAALWHRDDGRRLVLAGGDGSIHAVANLGGPPREVAVIPCGKANNIARSLAIPLDPGDAAYLAAHGGVRPIDLIAARTADGHERLVVESVSAGFLAQARSRYHAGNSGDLLAGVVAGTRALASFRPLAASVAAPPVTEWLPLSQLFVANLPLYAFGLHVAPHSDPDDATLDLVGFEAPSRAAVVAMIVHLLRGTAFAHPGVHAWRAREIELATDGCTPIVADSTDLGFGPVHLSVAPRALDLVRP